MLACVKRLARRLVRHALHDVVGDLLGLLVQARRREQSGWERRLQGVTGVANPDAPVGRERHAADLRDRQILGEGRTLVVADEDAVVLVVAIDGDHE